VSPRTRQTAAQRRAAELAAFTPYAVTWQDVELAIRFPAVPWEHMDGGYRRCQHCGESGPGVGAGGLDHLGCVDLCTACRYLVPPGPGTLRCPRCKGESAWAYTARSYAGEVLCCWCVEKLERRDRCTHRFSCEKCGSTLSDAAAAARLVALGITQPLLL
jgi:hypothetical protein